MERRIGISDIHARTAQIHQESSENTQQDHTPTQKPQKDFAVPLQATWTGNAVEVPHFNYSPDQEATWMPLDDY